MASKQCSVCSGSGQRDFVAGTNATSEYCHSCDGTGYIQVYEPAQTNKSTKKSSPKAVKTSGKGRKDDSNAKFIRVAVSIAVCIGTYLFSVAQISDSLLVSGAIALVVFLIVYRWFKIVMPLIVLVIIVFYFFGEKILSFF